MDNKKQKTWVARADATGPVNYHDASHGPDCPLKGWYTFIRCLADGCESLLPWPSDIQGTAAYFCPPHRAPYGA